MKGNLTEDKFRTCNKNLKKNINSICYCRFLNFLREFLHVIIILIWIAIIIPFIILTIYQESGTIIILTSISYGCQFIAQITKRKTYKKSCCCICFYLLLVSVQCLCLGLSEQNTLNIFSFVQQFDSLARIIMLEKFKVEPLQVKLRQYTTELSSIRYGQG